MGWKMWPKLYKTNDLALEYLGLKILGFYLEPLERLKQGITNFLNMSKIIHHCKILLSLAKVDDIHTSIYLENIRNKRENFILIVYYHLFVRELPKQNA